MWSNVSGTLKLQGKGTLRNTYWIGFHNLTTMHFQCILLKAKYYNHSRLPLVTVDGCCGLHVCINGNQNFMVIKIFICSFTVSQNVHCFYSIFIFCITGEDVTGMDREKQLPS